MSNWFKLNQLNPDVPINIDHTTLAKIIKFVKLPKYMKIEKVDVNINQEKIALIKNTTDEKYSPIITFHATSNIDVVQSILKYGYVLPNDTNPETGIIQEYRIGSMYGDGVYTSINPEFISGYADLDKDHNIYFMVNVVMLGQIEQIAPNEEYKYHFNTKIDTTMTYGMKLIVSRFTKRVVPIGTILVKTNIGGGRWYLNIDNKLFGLRECGDYTYGTVTFKKMISDGEQNPGKTPLGSFDYYAINHNDVMSLVGASKLSDMGNRSILIIPSKILGNKLVIESIDNFITNCSRVDVLIYYGTHGDLLTKNKDFKNELGKIKTMGAMSLQQYVSTVIAQQKISKKSVDNLAIILENLVGTISHKDTSIMYFFFDRYYAGSSIKDLCYDIRNMVKNCRTLVRSIYIDKVDYTNEAIKDTFNLKWLDTMSDSIYTHTFEHGITANFDRFLFECRSSSSSRNRNNNNNNNNKNKNDNTLGLSKLLNLMTDDLAHINLRTTVHYDIPRPLGKYGEGFLVHLTELPSWSTHSEGDIILLVYKGIPPERIYINGSPTKVLIDDVKTKRKVKNKDELTESEIQQRHQPYFVTFIGEVLKLLARFKNTIIIDPYLYAYYKNTLDQFLNNLTILFDQQIKKGKHLANIKHVYNYVNQLKSDLNLYGNIKSGLNFDGAFFERLKSMKFSKRILKRVTYQIDNKELSDEYEPKDERYTMENIMARAQTKGYLCQIINTDASCIDPWLIVVKKVSPIKVSIAEMYANREFGVPLSLENDSNWNGVLTPITPITPITTINDNKIPDDVIKISSNDTHHTKNIMIDKAFTAFMYSDNPYLVITNQKLALLTSSCVSIAEKILLHVKLSNRGKISPDRSHIKEQMLILDDLLHSIRYDGERYINLLENLIKDPYATLRDKQQTPSLIMVLGLIGFMVISAKNNDALKKIFDKNECICKAILLESLYRVVETSKKAEKITNVELLRKMFTNPKYIKIFFQNRLISSSPFAIVSFLEYCRALYEGNDIEQITSLYHETKITMNKFFEMYFENMMKQNKNHEKLQKAIVLVSSEDTKIDVDNFDAEVVINKYHHEWCESEKKLEEIKTKLLEAKAHKLNTKETRCIGKIKRYLANNEQYVVAHSGVPKVFSVEDVEKLNQAKRLEGERTLDNPCDQIKRLSNGLLKHHCCYEMCPDYLKNFATESDTKFNTRHGLYGHFKINMVMNNYYKGLHRTAKLLLYKHVEKDHFIESITSHMKKCAIERKGSLKRLVTSYDLDECRIDDDILKDIEFVANTMADVYFKQ